MMDNLKEHLNSVCRLCLTKVDDPSTMQTLEDEEADTMWTSSVRSFTVKEPVLSEILPNKMCTYCAVWITKLIHFKLQCTVSEHLLTSFLKHYKEEVKKTTAAVRVGEQQLDIPGPNTRELLSRCDEHLSGLHKAVQFTVTHLDECASNGQPVLPYRKTKTNQFFVMFIDQLRLYVNSVIPTDGEGMLRIHIPDMSKEQPWDSGNMPVQAQKNSKQTSGKFWDGLIQATFCPKFTQNDNNGAPSGEQPSSQYPLLQAVPSHSSIRSAAYSKKSQNPPLIHLHDDIRPQSSNLSKSVQLKQAELSATLTSQPCRLFTSKPQGSSKHRENISNLPKTAETRKKLGVSEVWSSNIVAQQQASSKLSEESVQLTGPAQNTNESRATQGKTLVQENLEDETLQSLVIHDLVECTQDVQKSMKQQLTGLKGQVVEHSGSLALSNSAGSAKKTLELVQASQHAQELNRGLENTLEQLKNEAKNRAENKKVIKNCSPKVRKKNSKKQESQEVLKKSSESQETVKQTLGMQVVNRVQEQTNKAGSKEIISQTTNLQKEPNKICQGQINKTTELQTSEKHQTGSEQPREVQMSAIQATEANKSTSSSSGQESSTKSTEKPRLQPKDKQRFYYLILQQTSQTNRKEKTVPLIIKCGKRVCSYEESVSTGPKKHIALRIESKPVDKVSQPSSAPNAGVYVLTPLVPVPKNTAPNVPSSLSSMSELKERRIIKEIPSGVSTSIDNENTIPSTSRSSQQPNINTSETSTAQKNSNLSEKNTENSAVNSNSQPIKRNEENRKSGEEAPTAEEPVGVSTGIIRVRQNLITDPPTRNSSHNSKNVPLSTSNVSQQNMQYNGTESEPSGQQSQAPIPTFSMASMNRMAVLQQQQANSRAVVMPVSSPLSHPVQRFQHSPQTLGTPVPVSYPQQPSVIASVVKKPVQQVSQPKNNPVFGTVLRHQMAQARTSTSTSQQPWSTISVPEYQKAQTGAATDSTRFTEGPRMTVLMAQTEKIPTSRLELQTNVPGRPKIATLVQTSVARQQQQQIKPATSISQANVLGQQQQAKPTASVSQRVMQSTNVVLQHQTKEVQSSQSRLVADKIQASNNEILSAGGTCFPNPTVASKAINVSVPKVYKPATGVPVPSASDNQSNKQQFLNVNTQYNRTLLQSKQQNALSTADSNGDVVVDVQRPSEDERRVVLESEAGARNTDQPGISVLPEVVQAIGPELGIFMGKDGLESSVCRTTPCKFPIMVPEHCVVSKQSNKSSMQRGPKGAAALARPVKSNIISRIKPNSRELPVVSEERRQKLPATISNPTSIRRSNLLIKSPGGVTSRKYFNRKKELNKQALPVHKEPEPPSNVTVHQLTDNMLQSEVTAPSEKNGEAKKPCDFQIKITKNNVQYKSSPKDHSAVQQTEFDSDSSDSRQPPAPKRRRVIDDDDNIKEVEKPSSKVLQLQPYQLGPCVSMVKQYPESPGRKEPESAPNVTVLHSEVAVSSENRGEAKKPCDFQVKVTKKNVKYKSSRMGHSVIKQTESSDSYEPPAKRIRVICDDNDIREVEKPSIKVWQLKSYQLAPYVSVTKLHPEFFKAGSAYNLKDLKVAAKARTLSMVLRKPRTVGKSVKSVLP